MLSNEQRRAWLVRGLQDPVKAYRAHAVGAAKRGIAFELTFAEWWALWEPHYEARGVHVGEKVMCRTGDVGSYAVGNVRIDTAEANHSERGDLYRSRQLSQNRLPAEERRHAPGGPADWMNRTNVFQPYTEESDLWT